MKLNSTAGHHCPAANLTVRSAQSLSSKYSDRRPDVNPGKRHVRKNASLCVRQDLICSTLKLILRCPDRQELGHTCHQAAPPCVLPDAAQISESSTFLSFKANKFSGYFWPPHIGVKVPLSQRAFSYFFFFRIRPRATLTPSQAPLSSPVRNSSLKEGPQVQMRGLPMKG